MPRYALKVSENLIDAASEITGHRMEVFGENLYLLLTPISEIEYNVKFVVEEDLLAEFKTDAELQIIG